jgi:hypothetical protein
MNIWRIVIPAALGTATFAGCFTYLVMLPSTLRDMTGVGTAALPRSLGQGAGGSSSTYIGDNEKAAAAYWDAAQAILRRAPNARASIDKPSSESIPLPRRRPIPRL